MSDDQRIPGAPAPHDEPPLTNQEIRELREMLEADRRVKWFWGLMKTISIWIIAVGGAFTMTWGMLVKLITNASSGE